MKKEIKVPLKHNAHANIYDDNGEYIECRDVVTAFNELSKNYEELKIKSKLIQKNCILNFLEKEIQKAEAFLKQQETYLENARYRNLVSEEPQLIRNVEIAKIKLNTIKELYNNLNR